MKALVVQVGSNVLYRELSQTVGINMQTFEKYVVILVKAYIVFNLTALNRIFLNKFLKNSRFFY